MNVARRYLTDFFHLFFPSLCEGCGKQLLTQETALCLNCLNNLSYTHYHHLPDNETAIRFSGRIPFIYATSLAWFIPDGILQQLIYALKYRNRKRVGEFLGHLLGKELVQVGWPAQIDAIVPVPLHIQKERKRGFNQSLLIAEGISKATGISVDSHMLVRTRKTDTQTNKTRPERVKNMENAFAVNLNALATRQQDPHILLVDDVLTTGATLESCALALRSAGIHKISIATIGIAVS